MDRFANTPVAAAAIPVPVSISATIEAVGNMDVFAIDLSVGEWILADIPPDLSMPLTSTGLPETRIVAGSLENAQISNQNSLPGRFEVRSQNVS